VTTSRRTRWPDESAFRYHVEMFLHRIDIFRLRNLHALSLNPAPGINLITGPNASGKTSILEAIHLLSYARSFRTARIADLITQGSDSMVVSGRLRQTESERRIGIGFRGNRREIRIDGQTAASRAELLGNLPVRLIDPARHTLMDDSPRARRRFLDWGVFYHEPSYLEAWRNYRRALNQRNAALKRRERQGAILWGQEAAKYGKIVSRCRRDYLEAFTTHFVATARQLGLGENLELRYLPGWTGEKDLLTALTDDLDKDLRAGCTHSGPHRDDFMVLHGGRPVRRRFSRGQMKLLAYALILAQGRPMTAPGCLLIDDVASELDLKNQALLNDVIVHSKEQIFITATHSEAVAGLLPHVDRIFRLKQGGLTSPSPHSPSDKDL